MTDKETVDLLSSTCGIKYTETDNPITSDVLAIQLAEKYGVLKSKSLEAYITNAERFCLRSEAVRRAVVRLVIEIGETK